MVYKLCDLAKIKYGKNQSKVVDINGKYPIYGTGGLMGYAKEFLYDKPSVLIGRKGTIDKVRFIDSPFWTVDTLFYTIINENIVYPQYFYYLLKNVDLTKFNEGTTIPSLRTETLNRIELEVPNKRVQSKIISLIGGIDEKIRLNNDINDNLHSQLDSLFYEFWNEKKLIKNVEWKQKRLGDLVDIKRGGSPRPIADYISDSGYSWLKISDVTSVESPYIWSIKEHIKEEGLKKTVFLKAGNLVLSNSATPGIPKIIGLDTCIHDGWLYFINSKLSNYFLYLLFRNIRTKLISFSNGSIFNNLKTDIVKNYIIDYPGFDVLNQFDNLVYPLFEGLKVISVENAKLIELRDTLLPKLMSGEIDVSNIKLDL